MRLIFLGPPGVGKGTQAKLLSQRYGVTHISTGDVLRSEMARGTPLGSKAAEYIRKGLLVPDALVVEVVVRAMNGAPKGFFLDGFPRTLEQARALDGYLQTSGIQVEGVVHLRLGLDEIVRRLTARRNCAGCGELYNTLTKPPRSAGRCDGCGGTLSQREDDTEAVVRKRLVVYEDLTRPLVTHYKSAGGSLFYEEVDGSLPVEGVTQKLVEVLERCCVPKPTFSRPPAL